MRKCKMERCPYCFQPLPENGICSCHYKETKNAAIQEALHPGSVVGACYQIGAVLGRGGFGITYSAWDLNTNRIVAIKEFFPQEMAVRYGTVSSGEGIKGRSNYVIPVNTEGDIIYKKSLELFFREAQALGKLGKQPNVVHSYYVFRENGTAYIVMEYVEGRSLKSIVRERGYIPEDELLPLLDPALAALEKVHSAGILHRDIAPDNIMISNGEPVLVDFGAARIEKGHQSSMLIGKKGFSSPEQMAGGTQDARSDIYALGATYYYALSGITPQDSAMRGLMKDELVPLKELIPGISQKTSSAVAKAMALRPDDRFASVADFREMLGTSGSDENEQIYQTALLMMKNGTEDGYRDATRLFRKIRGYKDSIELAGMCVQKIKELQESGNREPNPSDRRKKPTVLWIILAAAAALGLILFFVLKNSSKPEAPAAAVTETVLPDEEDIPEVEATVLPDEEEIPEAEVTILPDEEEIPEAEVTVLPEYRETADVPVFGTETQQYEPTETPPVPTVTPVPSTQIPEWTAPVKTIISALDYKSVIPAEDFGKVMLVRDKVGCGFSLRAPEDGDYLFSVRAPNLTREDFKIQFYNEEKQLIATALYLRSDEIQTFVLKDVKKGQLVCWWDDDNSGRYYTLLDPFELMITVNIKDNTEAEPEEERDYGVAPGDILTFGRYEQDGNSGADEIEWQVLEVKNGEALVISRYALAYKPFDDKTENVVWETSTLRQWLNGEFYNTAFSAEEKTRIREVTLSNPSNPVLSSGMGNETRDRIFLLSYEEAEKYFADDAARGCQETDQAYPYDFKNEDPNTKYWWLRTPGFLTDFAADVFFTGVMDPIGSKADRESFVRPAFRLGL